MKIDCFDGECYNYYDDTEFVGYASQLGVGENFSGEMPTTSTQNTATTSGGTKSGTGWLDVLNTLAGQTGAIFGNTKPTTGYNTGTGGVYPYQSPPAKKGISGLAVAGIVLGSVALVVVVVVVTKKKK